MLFIVRLSITEDYHVNYVYFQYGAMEITNHNTKHKAVLNFKQGGWFGKDLHKIEGFIYDTK